MTIWRSKYWRVGRLLLFVINIIQMCIVLLMTQAVISDHSVTGPPSPSWSLHPHSWVTHAPIVHHHTCLISSLNQLLCFTRMNWLQHASKEYYFNMKVEILSLFHALMIWFLFYELPQFWWLYHHSLRIINCVCHDMFQVGSCPRVTLIASSTDQTLQCHSANNVSIPRDYYGSCFNGESWNDFYFESKQPEIVYIAPLKSETGVFDRWWCMQDPLWDWELFMTCSVQWIPCVVQWIISTVEQLDTVTQDDGAHRVTQCWSPLCSSPSQHSLTHCDSAAGGDGVSPTADAA